MEVKLLPMRARVTFIGSEDRCNNTNKQIATMKDQVKKKKKNQLNET